jgi:hypothetical protein
MKYLKKFNESTQLDLDNLSNPLKVIEIANDSIIFENGITLSSYHQDDCCENHYLGFDDITLDDFDGLEFDLSNDNFFRRIDGYGIELMPLKGYTVKIPGYGSNNGYYSSNLSLMINDSEGKIIKQFDISECQDISGDE